MNREDYIIVPTPLDFNLDQCLVYLNRSNQEVLHKVNGKKLTKLLKINESPLLIEITSGENALTVEFPFGTPSQEKGVAVYSYIWDWFDLGRNLEGFYKMANEDLILQNIVPKHSGLRIVGIPDLFEALTWAVIGQQINLTFAYTLKKRFVEHFGEKLEHQDEEFWLYPRSETIAALTVNDLKGLQFTTRKAEYVIGIAKAIVSREITKQGLLQLDYSDMKNRLMKLRGVGEWTADYVMMRCLHQTSAFPAADIGIHHALRKQFGLDRKPSTNYVEKLSWNWGEWRAYAAFYLWRSQYG
ncbi:DNA-3-methyladenine glycosylase [Halobacillus shinanisalinarum]|uniref:DNA-3-methyladenine glycosylase II n=1 Tax=Halobacillus shinanisalinarum TaxID=2932258 RepID=A0ABY4H4E6_9BACI|nr:DNA-3-methyladenine glycosylase [Halobacillus shinanisalinarum]UOQ95338.1 DNA-3-methyladenine glycosylase [Halobacillus shinanisalinarum]